MIETIVKLRRIFYLYLGIECPYRQRNQDRVDHRNRNLCMEQPTKLDNQFLVDLKIQKRKKNNKFKVYFLLSFIYYIHLND